MSLHDGLRLVEFGTLAAAAAAALLGLFVAWRSYRQFRAAGRGPMRFLWAGMVVLFGLGYVLAVVATGALELRVVPLRYQGGIRLAIRGVQLVGVSAIAYGLFLRG